MADTKRKTHTSTAVKRRYNDKNYTLLSYREDKEVAALFRRRCEELGVPQAQIFKAAVQDFLEKHPEQKAEG